uniref:EamA domain-containing protein n=1 Tax=Alexandrium catenella TaxID=2925 RepID=A0A7S1LN85_ALECA
MAEQISAWRMPLADKLRFLVLGLFVSMNAGGNILALQALSPITVAIFQPMIPVLAGITAALLGIEELRPLKAIGILCAAAGAVVVVVTNPHAHKHTAAPGGGAGLGTGLPCLIVNVFGGAWYIVFQKGILNRYPPIATAAASFGVAACIIFIACLITVGSDGHAWRLGESWKATFALIYAILLVTSLNYSLLSWANKRSTPSTVTSFMTLQPICAAILSCIFLHDVLTWGQIGGGIAIVAGLLAFLLSKPSESSEAEARPLLVPPEEVGGRLPAGRP